MAHASYALAIAAVLWVVPAPPSPMPDVIRQDCPVGIDVVCFLSRGPSGRPSVYLSNTRDEFNREHELGHAYDFEQLDDGERRAIAHALGYQAWPVEEFANFYAGCRMVVTPKRNPMYDDAKTFYGKFRSVPRIARRCRLIARAGD
jgi:hypothetical protein